MSLMGRFETLHDPLASPRRLMRILGPIVESFVLAMFDVKAHIRPRSAVRTQLVRDHHARRRAGGFQELLHAPLRSARVSSALDQDVENEAILVDSAPEPLLFARDRDNDFVQMPFVTASGAGWRIRSENGLPNFRPTGARFHRSRQCHAPPAFPRPCASLGETGNTTKRHN
ncbi:hypothetical protein ABIF79_008259 [Bradyrhizobium japonicum]